MAAEWFYMHGAQQIGPLSAGEIRALARDGSILPGTPIRKSDTSSWMKAGRIKGLFESTVMTPSDPEDAEGPDPLIALTSRAASSVASAAGSAASAIGGAVSGWMARREERKVELLNSPPAVPAAVVQSPPTAGPGWLAALSRDNQNPEVVASIAERVQQILMSDEQLTYVAVQNKPVLNWMPDCIALTNKRFIFYHPKMFGRVDFEDYIWRELRDARLSEDIVGSTFSVLTAAGRRLSLDYLPKAQARAVYRIAQEMEQRSLEERRARDLEEKKAIAGGTVVQTYVGSTVPAAAPVAADNDPVRRLQQLKNMADAGLITPAEYDAKKADILSRM